MASCDVVFMTALESHGINGGLHWKASVEGVGTVDATC